MGSKIVNENVHAPAESANSAQSLYTDEDRNTTSLPSPPFSVGATESDSGRRENDSHSTEVAGGELSISRSSACATKGVNSGSSSIEALLESQANRSNRRHE